MVINNLKVWLKMKWPRNAPPRPVGNRLVPSHLGIEMAYIPGGSFTMGRGKEEDALARASRIEQLMEGYKNELPAHSVFLDDFFMAKNPITVDQFTAFVEETNYRTQAELASGMSREKYDTDLPPANAPITWRTPDFLQEPDHPVTCVSWKDCQNFINWLNKKTGLTYRLPSEAEWEYAARAGSSGYFFFGKELQKSQARYKGGYSRSEKEQYPMCTGTLPVACYPANSFGLHDMHGNVSEWCNDVYEESYYRYSPLTNPKGPKAVEETAPRVLRGGGWNCPVWLCRSAFRGRTYPDDYSSALGFRLAMSSIL